MFRSSVADAPDSPLLVYFDSVLTAGDVDRVSNALAVALIEGGFTSGDRLALHTQNVPQYVIALIAAWKLGGIAVAINPMLAPREIQKLIADSKPAAFIRLSELYSDGLADMLDESSVSRVITTSALDSQPGGNPRVLPDQRIDAPAGTEDLKSLVAQV